MIIQRKKKKEEMEEASWENQRDRELEKGGEGSTFFIKAIPSPFPFLFFLFLPQIEFHLKST